MKKLFVTAFIASSLITGPGMLVSSTGALAQRGCDTSAPAAWFRPGGFCDSIGASKSLTGPLDSGCTDYDYDYGNEELIGMVGTTKGERVQVALTCVIDCSYDEASLMINALPNGDRLRMAQSCPSAS